MSVVLVVLETAQVEVKATNRILDSWWLSYSIMSAPFMKHEGSLLSSQQPAAEPCLEPYESSPHPHTLLLLTGFNYSLLSKPRFSKRFPLFLPSFLPSFLLPSSY